MGFRVIGQHSLFKRWKALGSYHWEPLGTPATHTVGSRLFLEDIRSHEHSRTHTLHQGRGPRVLATLTRGTLCCGVDLLQTWENSALLSNATRIVYILRLLELRGMVSPLLQGLLVLCQNICTYVKMNIYPAQEERETQRLQIIKQGVTAPFQAA